MHFQAMMAVDFYEALRASRLAVINAMNDF
jgi:hypothetical protein